MADWTDLKRDGVFRAYMTAPHQPDQILEEMEGVFWDDATFSAGYYSNTRTSGKLKVLAGSWVPNTLIRIDYEIPRWGYTRTIGTYAAKAGTATSEAGTWTEELELYSMLYVMSRDKAKRNTLIAAGTKISAAIQNEVNAFGMRVDVDGANDSKLQTVKMLEAGATRLSRLYALCDISNNRLDVSPRGVPTVSKYVRPSDRPASLGIWTSGSESLVFEGITRTHDYMERPNTAIVSYTYQEDQDFGDAIEKQIIGYATLESAGLSQTDASVFPIGEYYEVDSLDPPTQAQAERQAATLLNGQQNAPVEWSFSTPYLPLWEGDIVNLYVNDGPEKYQGVRKCLVKNIEIQAPFGDLTLTLKETLENDDTETDEEA